MLIPLALIAGCVFIGMISSMHTAYLERRAADQLEED